MGLDLAAGGTELHYTYDTQDQGAGIEDVLERLRAAGVAFRDLSTQESSLEDIFVGLLERQRSGEQDS